jgi:hypothetical protein
MGTRWQHCSTHSQRLHGHAVAALQHAFAASLGARAWAVGCTASAAPCTVEGPLVVAHAWLGEASALGASTTRRGREIAHTHAPRRTVKGTGGGARWAARWWVEGTCGGGHASILTSRRHALASYLADLAPARFRLVHGLGPRMTWLKAPEIFGVIGVVCGGGGRGLLCCCSLAPAPAGRGGGVRGRHFRWAAIGCLVLSVGVVTFQTIRNRRTVPTLGGGELCYCSLT